MEAAELLVGPRVNEHLTRLINSVCLSVAQERCVIGSHSNKQNNQRREGRLEGRVWDFISIIKEQNTSFTSFHISGCSCINEL
jgi:hypothetical protein